MDALRISPEYTSCDWERLDCGRAADWVRAAAILQDRLDGRFLGFATRFLESKFSGFVVLAVDCLLAETLQQFAEGVTDGSGRSKEMVTRFLEGARFQPDFDGVARKKFYDDIRCGLLHQAEAKGKWLIRRRQVALLTPLGCGEGYVIDVERFHAAMRSSLCDYIESLVRPESSVLRANLWRKMDAICTVRRARGALYEVDTSAASSVL